MLFQSELGMSKLKFQNNIQVFQFFLFHIRIRKAFGLQHEDKVIF